MAGFAAGLLLGRPSRLAAGLVRGLGFAGVGAVGGGLFPLVVSATAGQLPAEVSSALTWGVVTGLAAVIAYTWTQRPQPQRFPAIDTDDQQVSDRETVVLRSGVRLGVSPAGRSEADRTPADLPAPSDDEPEPVVTFGRDPGPAGSSWTTAAPAAQRVVPAARTGTAGGVVHIAPVLLVTVV